MTSTYISRYSDIVVHLTTTDYLSSASSTYQSSFVRKYDFLKKRWTICLKGAIKFLRLSKPLKMILFLRGEEVNEIATICDLSCKIVSWLKSSKVFIE